ncbi:MAG: hypothetical protein ACXVRZ_01665 [Gaiellaceae bacterium]
MTWAARAAGSAGRSDHTDIRPTMMMLLGLKDDHSLRRARPHRGPDRLGGPATAKKYGAFQQLAAAYKQIDATVGPFGLATLAQSTNALGSNSQNDSTYTTTENQLIELGQRRDALASQMIALLEAAEFKGHAHPAAAATRGAGPAAARRRRSVGRSPVGGARCAGGHPLRMSARSPRVPIVLSDFDARAGRS